jgi:hypothetical protein
VPPPSLRPHGSLAATLAAARRGGGVRGAAARGAQVLAFCPCRSEGSDAGDGGIALRVFPHLKESFQTNLLATSSFQILKKLQSFLRCL